MSEFTAPSGAKVVINAASWEEANKLKKAIERALALSPSLHVMQMVFLVDSSDEVEKAMWGCLVRCLRNDQKIVPETFNPVEARADYYEIVAECLKENLSPLVVSLRSKLSEYGITVPQAMENADANRESKSPTTPSSSPSA